MTDERFETLLASALNDAQIRDGISRSQSDAEGLVQEVRAARSRIARDAHSDLESENAAAREVAAAEDALLESELRLRQRIDTRQWFQQPLLLSRAVRRNLEQLDKIDRSGGHSAYRAALRRTFNALAKQVPADDVRLTTLDLRKSSEKYFADFILVLLCAIEAWVILSASVHFFEASWSLREFREVYFFEIAQSSLIPAVAGGVVLLGVLLAEAFVIRVAPAILYADVMGVAKVFAPEHEQLENVVAKARLRLETLVAATNRSVMRCLLAELRLKINAAFMASHALLLPAVRPSGLAEVFDERYEIPTEAKRDVLRKLETMPGGAIGIGGPRGAGKSTLLRAIANGVSEIEVAGELRPVIGVLAAAPVQYDAREYLLHLFSNTCSRVLGNTRTRTRAEEARMQEPAWTRYVPTIRAVSTPMAVVAAAVGASMLVMGLLALVWLRAEQAMSVLQARPIDFITRGFFWTFGAFLLASVGRRLAQHADDVERANLPKEATRIPKPANYSGSDESWDTIVKSARGWEDEIRFQRTYSQGWSGALKLPVGMEGSVNQALSWSHRQLSLPELTKSYTEFLAELATHMVVIIAIDELDKITSDEKAQEFLNEIKAIFGIERCFYLLSVSDSAMSSFARRGLPIRDAFDSALDEIVRVEYLTQEAANELISRRIVRFPLPFVSFCHCLSGGLPRDLIRACRDVFDAAEQVGSRELGQVIRAVLRDDLKQKIAATVTAITQSHGDDSGTTIIEHLGRMKTAVIGIDALLADYGAILDAAATTDSPPCRSLAVDLATYYLYAATLLDIFDNENCTAGTDTAIFEELAALRRRLEIDSEAIRRELVALRVRRNLAVPREPLMAKPRVAPARRYLPRMPIKQPDPVTL